jgi:hypothetical protein
MEGYDVVTLDDDKVGHVVGTRDEFLIVEHGAIFKSKHAVPREYAHVHDDERLVRITVAKEIVDDSPKVHDDFDERAVREYYGLGGGYEAPESEGYGTLGGDETALSAEVQGAAHGADSPTEERARVRESLRPETYDPADEGLPGAQIRATSGSD